MAFPAPFTGFEDVVRPEWIDANGHMNLAYHHVMFDHAVDLICAAWDLDWAYTKRTNHGLFAVETHTLYEQELLEGERARASTWVVGVDAKRLHVAHELYRAADGARAACWEAVLLHVDLGARRVVPWPEPQAARMREAAAAHAAVPRPDWIGRRVGLPPPRG
jgi:acyl-CoA thioester hydrolase